MTVLLRPNRALFRFSGPEAQKLLFDVVTGRLVEEPGPALWWALLSPQGKIQAEGLSSWQEGAFWLDVDRSVADDFLRRMRMYKLRANLTIDDLRQTHDVGWSPEGAKAGVTDARLAGLGARVVAPKQETGGWDDGAARHAALRIGAGIAELGPDFAPDSIFPHDIGMDILGGVDFKKGCYVGQEVVSRMQHRGTARRRPVIVTGIAAPAGAQVMMGEREAGSIGEVVGGKAVALLRLDRITDPGAATVGGLPVTLTLPEWASYKFGESGPAD